VTRLYRLLLCLVLAALAACAQQATRDAGHTADWLAPQSVPRVWSIDARLAVSNGKDGGSGRLHWTQEGDNFTISLRAPISGQSWLLSGDRSHARLEGVRPHAVLGSSAQEVLRRELGWELPVGEMKSWLFGVGFSQRAAIEADEVGKPVAVRDRDWQLTYRDWRDVSGISVPARIIAKKPPYQVRLAIQRWTLSQDGGEGAED
jgi:outer membrane lipoprotein LolB